jgi:hypothetical protein
MAAALAVAFALSTQSATAQGVPVAEAQAFMGAWVISVEGNQLELNITDAEGQVAADVVVMGTTSKITTIEKTDESLSLAYVVDLDGQQAPISIRLTPDGTNLATVIDVADGMYTANATATRKP